MQNHLVVGYVSDYDDNSNEDGIAYTMTQYVLAPIILVRGIKRNFIIGNFHSIKPNIKAYEKENLSLIRDFGNGVILFERMDNYCFLLYRLIFTQIYRQPTWLGRRLGHVEFKSKVFISKW